jgi:hypothetical protein
VSLSGTAPPFVLRPRLILRIERQSSSEHTRSGKLTQAVRCLHSVVAWSHKFHYASMDLGCNLHGPHAEFLQRMQSLGADLL